MPGGSSGRQRGLAEGLRPGPGAQRPLGRPPGPLWAALDSLAARLDPGDPDRKWRSRPVSRVLSWTTIPLGPASRQGSSSAPGDGSSQPIVPLFGLAPSGVYRAVRRCPRTRWALTPPFHPYHAHLAMPFGGLLSVALAVGSRRPGVTWHSALWSPDFPRRDRVATRLSWPTPPPPLWPLRRGRSRFSYIHCLLAPMNASLRHA